MRALGGNVDTEPDRLVVHGGVRLRPGVVQSRGDHRIAMAGAIAALGAVRGEPVRVLGWDCVNTSYPGFLADLVAVTA